MKWRFVAYSQVGKRSEMFGFLTISLFDTDW
jgi:hypothetical protein